MDELADCRACPRDCGVDRLRDKRAVCRTGRHARVSSAFAHHGEENPLRGWRGSGTIFFAHCNLRCVFCQNYEISWGGEGGEVTAPELAQLMLRLQDQGCHNINFVTPEHVVPQVLEALPHAVEAGLNVPIVYNTSAYDAISSLHLLDGVVDIFMPDFKIWDPSAAKLLLRAEDYPEVARRALREMHRQVGDLVVNEAGLAQRGLLVRHLVMPEGLAGTDSVMKFLAAEVSRDIYINIMGQYHPEGLVGRDDRYAEIDRRVSRDEMADAHAVARRHGLWRFDGLGGRAL
jgi:putative pyruvate formate lyase activating enzyme